MSNRESIQQLIKAERRQDTFRFILDVIQRGRKRPKKYMHDLIMPAFLFEELHGKSIIAFQDMLIEDQAFFEFDGVNVTLSFISLFACEDVHTKILRYLVVKFAGSCPIGRYGRFDFDSDVQTED
jgi:hypothetical protein